MKFRKFIQTLHRWMGLLLAVQIALWMMSGAIMSWFAIELVKGQTTASFEYASELPVTGYYPLGGIVAQLEGVTKITLTARHGRAVYEAESAEGPAVFDADTGDRLPLINRAQAQAIAERDFIGDGDVVEVVSLDKPPHEYRGPAPVWRVSFGDKNQTRLYISPQTGAVLSRRNRVWRLYDFFWMLHIMDYGERENFNNPLIKAFSATGLAFALSGLFLVLTRLRSSRYGDDLKKLLKPKTSD